MRTAWIRGSSAATSKRAASRTAPGSPTGYDGIVRRGMRTGVAGIARSCISWSSTMSTGSIGGVIAIMYARTADSANDSCDVSSASVVADYWAVVLTVLYFG